MGGIAFSASMSSQATSDSDVDDLDYSSLQSLRPRDPGDPGRSQEKTTDDASCAFELLQPLTERLISFTPLPAVLSS